MPGGEGMKAAELLSDQGVRVELIDDSMVFDIARECDAGLCGADSISPQGVVNKVGTYSLAMACRESGIGCHVLATSSKCTPITPTDMMITMHSVNGIEEMEKIFELVPSKSFDSCINEDGSSTMAQLIARIQEMRLARSWKGTLSI
jgi:translation initiation factor 2B subunit (eIF-2B alpha/beta/delta family)